jgi:hypothetical protein
LGKDYNGDGRGVGFNVPSLLGIHALPPFLHNGAAESLAAVVGDVKHRTANGQFPDRLTNATDQVRVVAFLETINAATVPFVTLSIRREANQILVGFDSIVGARYVLEAKAALADSWNPIGSTVIGNGERLEIPTAINTETGFVRLVAGP